MKSLFTNAKIITSSRIFHGCLEIIDDKIGIVDPSKPADLSVYDHVYDIGEKYLSPGFVDVHTHGAGGSDFMDGDLEAVYQACETHMRHGTTALLPTTLCSTNQRLSETFNIISKAMQTDRPLPEIMGLHLEGPYLSVNQSGAMNPKYIKNVSREDYENLYDLCPLIKMWTVAPELKGALEMGRWMRDHHIVASIGHTDAVFEDFEQAIDNGFTKVTHIFNAMSRLVRRNAKMYPGAAESALYFDELIVELIADGKHVPPSLIKLIHKCKGTQNVCLVTDSMRAAGTDVAESIIGGLEEGHRVIIEDGVAYLPDKSYFGGSVCTTDRLVRTIYKSANIRLHEAVAMMTSVPAKIMGLNHRIGALSKGMDADIVVFDDNIRVEMVMVKGELTWNTITRERE